MQTQQIQIRKQKGQEIAKKGNVKFQGNKWLVPSQSSNKQYEVMLGLGTSNCTCPDFKERCDPKGGGRRRREQLHEVIQGHEHVRHNRQEEVRQV